LRRQKNLKNNYYYSDNENEILGTTDNPCRTMINLFTVFRNNHNRKVFFDIDNPTSKIIIKENSLQYSEINNDKIYKYQGKIITRKDFILHLKCEEQKTASS
jgi:hypothetical protein